MDNDDKYKNERPIGFFILLAFIILTWIAIGLYIVTKPSAQSMPDISTIILKQDELTKKIDALTNIAPATVSNSTIEQMIAEAKQRELETVSITAELATINSRTAALEARMAEFGGNIEKTASHENANNLMLSALRLRDTVRESRNFESELVMVRAFADDNTEIDASIEVLNKYAKGTVSASTLKDEFEPVAEAIIKLARIQKENPNLLDKAVLRFEKIVQVRKINSAMGDNNVEDIIARVYNLLQKNDLAAAVKEINKLPEDAKTLANYWLEKANANLTANDTAEKIFLAATKPVVSGH